jgi:glycosyltransferase involved in cell wall biosynthesis
MSSKGLVSIIMNCYNGETYLRDAIQSIIDQNYNNWELIFWIIIQR